MNKIFLNKFKGLQNLRGKKIIITVIVIGFVIFRLIADHQAAVMLGYSFKLDRLHPNYYYYDHLINFIDKKEPLHEESIRRFKRYYRMASKFVPHFADTHGMLGYISYLSGDREQAIASYERALELNPHFFWFNYNLGLIYFKNGEYAKAATLLERGLQSSKNFSVRFIVTSKMIYMPFFLRKDAGCRGKVKCDLDKVNKTAMFRIIDRQFRKGYQDCLTLLALSHFYQDHFKEVLGMAQYAKNKDIKNDDILFYAGVAAYNLEDYERANYFLAKHIDLYPNHAEAYVYLGLSLKGLDEEGPALNVLKRAVEIGQIHKDAFVPVEKGIELVGY